MRRLHPLTPLLKSWVVVAAGIGYLSSQLTGLVEGRLFGGGVLRRRTTAVRRSRSGAWCSSSRCVVALGVRLPVLAVHEVRHRRQRPAGPDRRAVPAEPAGEARPAAGGRHRPTAGRPDRRAGRAAARGGRRRLERGTAGVPLAARTPASSGPSCWPARPGSTPRRRRRPSGRWCGCRPVSSRSAACCPARPSRWSWSAIGLAVAAVDHRHRRVPGPVRAGADRPRRRRGAAVRARTTASPWPSRRTACGSARACSTRGRRPSRPAACRRSGSASRCSGAPLDLVRVDVNVAGYAADSEAETEKTSVLLPVGSRAVAHERPARRVLPGVEIDQLDLVPAPRAGRAAAPDRLAVPRAPGRRAGVRRSRRAGSDASSCSCRTPSRRACGSPRARCSAGSGWPTSAWTRPKGPVSVLAMHRDADEARAILDREVELERAARAAAAPDRWELAEPALTRSGRAAPARSRPMACTSQPKPPSPAAVEQLGGGPGGGERA